MKKGVVTKLILVVALALLLPLPVHAIIITPAEVELKEYNTQQETIITFYNDEAAPKKIIPIPGTHSIYLAPYITITPNEFVLEPNSQQNIKIRTTFPDTLSPQIHSLTILPEQGASKGATLTFRPPGDQQPKLKLISVLADVDKNGETAIISITYKNLGNVFVFATPTVRIYNDSGQQKQITYPKPVMIQPEEEFSLDVLQGIEGMTSGNYNVEVDTAYKVDDYSGSTGKEIGTLYIETKEKRKKSGSFSFSSEWLYIMLGVLLIGGYFIVQKRPSGNKEVQEARKEVYKMRHEVHSMANETRELIKDINDWFQQGVR